MIFQDTFFILFGVILLAAITTQFIIRKPGPARYFSFYTILSNLYAGVVLILKGSHLLPDPLTNLLQGSSTLYIIITGLGFSILLKGENGKDGLIPWINILLHYVSPIVLLATWIFLPRETVSPVNTLLWLIPLFMYLVFTIIRGMITGWYPYVFLNPKTVGSTGVKYHIMGLLVMSIILDLGLSAISFVSPVLH